VIPVREQPEPPNFSVEVRIPGQTFLKRIPKPTSKQFNKERHWRNSIDDLYRLYNGLCAYSAHWIPRDVGRATVDHFIPKETAPDLAYEWRNFRLCSEKLNNNKGNLLDVMDPFQIKPGWFVIDFPTFFIKAEARLPQYLKDRIDQTITCLGLNDDDHFVQERANLTKLYCDGEITFGFLEKRYPFIAYELQRQDLKERIKTMLRMPTAAT